MVSDDRYRTKRCHLGIINVVNILLAHITWLQVSNKELDLELEVLSDAYYQAFIELLIRIRSTYK